MNHTPPYCNENIITFDPKRPINGKIMFIKDLQTNKKDILTVYFGDISILNITVFSL